MFKGEEIAKRNKSSQYGKSVLFPCSILERRGQWQSENAKRRKSFAA